MHKIDAYAHVDRTCKQRPPDPPAPYSGTALSAPYPVHAMFPFYKPDVALKVVNMHN